MFIMTCLLILPACAKKHVTTRHHQKKAATQVKEVEKPEKYSEEGIASWYGRKFHGRKTANGEHFNMNKMTAAHRTLPFGTLVMVTNLTNGKSCEVRINDRGPVKRTKRLIDLSRAAAKKLGFIKSGTVKVKVEEI